MQPLIIVQDLKKAYTSNGKKLIFSNFSLEVKKGEFLSLFGPNGIGKTTLLNLITGLVKKQKGVVKITGLEGKKPKIGFMFQNYRDSLFPWLTARENIVLPLRINGLQEKNIKDSLNWVRKLVDSRLDLNKYPYQFSDGQQQLIALMRNIIFKPDILIMDEPFSSLDFQTTFSLLIILMRMWLEIKNTVIFVSHDIDSALFLSQRIILLKGQPAKIAKIITNKTPYPRSLNYISSKEITNLKKQIVSVYEKEVNIN